MLPSLCQGRLHSGQSVLCDPGHTQTLQLLKADVGIHDVLDCIGQLLQFTYCVDLAATDAGRVQHIAQQTQFLGRIHTGYADGRIIIQSRICDVVVQLAIGAFQDGRIGLDNCLDLFLGINLRAPNSRSGQDLVDHLNRGLRLAVETSDTQDDVVITDRGLRANTTIRVVFDLFERSILINGVERRSNA